MGGDSGGGMGGGGMGGGATDGGASGGMGMGSGNTAGGDGMRAPATDHEAARSQRMRGAAPSLATLLAEVRRRHPGKVLDVRLQRGPAGSAYVFTIMTPRNTVRRVRVPLPAGVAPRRPQRTYNFNRSRPQRQR